MSTIWQRYDKIEGVVFYIKHGVCVCILCHFIRLSLICHRIIPRLQTGASGSDCERVGGRGCHWADVELSRWRRLAADDLRRSVCVDDSTWRRLTTTFTFHWRRGHCSMACRRRGDSIRAFLYCGLTINGLVQVAITVFDGMLQTSSCSTVVDSLRPTQKYYFRLFAVNWSCCLGVSAVSPAFVLSRGSSVVQLTE